MSLKVISTNSESTKRKDKIPEYAKDFRKEWLYIRGIDKKCGDFISRLDFIRIDIFNSSTANNLKCYIKKFLKDQERGRLKDISGIYFEYFDASNIEFLLEKLDYYNDFYIDSDRLDRLDSLDSLDRLYFNEEYFDLIIDRNFPGYKEFLELISLVNDKVKTEDPIFKNNIDSDSDSDNDNDNDNDNDSDSDSDSDY